MSQRAVKPAILAHFTVWVLFYAPVCLGCNSDYLTGFQRHQRKFNVHESDSTVHYTSMDKHKTRYKTVKPTRKYFDVKLLYLKNNFFRGKPIVFPRYEILHKDSDLPEITLHHRYRRSEVGAFSGNLNQLKQHLYKDS